jgi:hypothetical protein
VRVRIKLPLDGPCRADVFLLLLKAAGAASGRLARARMNAHNWVHASAIAARIISVSLSVLNRHFKALFKGVRPNTERETEIMSKFVKKVRHFFYFLPRFCRDQFEHDGERQRERK